MPQQQIKFNIRQDGTVTEEVSGVIGNECENITRTIEKKLGSLTYREVKPEYYNNVTLQHNQDETQEQTTTCLLYTSPSPRDATLSRMPSSA